MTFIQHEPENSIALTVIQPPMSFVTKLPHELCDQVTPWVLWRSYFNDINSTWTCLCVIKELNNLDCDIPHELCDQVTLMILTQHEPACVSSKNSITRTVILPPPPCALWPSYLNDINSTWTCLCVIKELNNLDCDTFLVYSQKTILGKGVTIWMPISVHRLCSVDFDRLV